MALPGTAPGPPQADESVAHSQPWLELRRKPQTPSYIWGGVGTKDVPMIHGEDNQPDTAPTTAWGGGGPVPQGPSLPHQDGLPSHQSPDVGTQAR